MARPQLDRRRQAGASSIRRPIAAARSYAGGMRDAAGQRERPVRLDDPERHEQARDGRAVVDPAERVGDAAERLGPVDGLVRHRRADDEPGDEVALGPDEGGDLRPHADAGRRDRRGVLHLPGDPQEVRVVAGQADDPALVGAGRVDAEVPVRDPAREGGQRQVAPGRAPGPAAAPRTSVVVQLARGGWRSSVTYADRSASPVAASASTWTASSLPRWATT